MASILDRYGIKEVADFTFYAIDDSTGKPSYPVLYLDTLKVSTVEQTADSVDAKGGKGNTTLLSWDTNKEINVTIEDALFSAKSLAIMFGNGTVTNYSGNDALIMRSETFTATAAAVPTSAGWKTKYTGPNGKEYTKLNPKFYDEQGVAYGIASTLTKDATYFCSYDIAVEGGIIDVSAAAFPGTYYCVGDTYARNDKSGNDEFFQFIIPKAKVQAANTITLQADGDPSTFSMSLKVLRPADGVMMKLVKYNAVDGTAASASSTSVDHNHVLSFGTMSISGTGNKTLKVDDASAATSSAATVATVAVASEVVTVTGVAPGHAVITVSDAESKVLGTIDVTVTAAG